MFIKNIKIEKFKGFSDKVEIPDMTDKSLLVYGENGSGKSSLYEALKLAMYYSRMDSKAIEGAINPSEAATRRDNWLRNLAYTQILPFTVEINNTPYDTLNTSNVDCFMLSYKDCHRFPYDNDGKLSLKALLDNLYFPDFPADFATESYDV
ncbi:MAG: AAA family ATPase, partial [Muribaculaceae bacterium]|nr:AAA family ATPase [Muribaculaceae bacterium]